MDVSMSMDQTTPVKGNAKTKKPVGPGADAKGISSNYNDSKSPASGDPNKTQPIANKPFDEALEFSAGSDDSVDTVNEKKSSNKAPVATAATASISKGGNNINSNSNKNNADVKATVPATSSSLAPQASNTSQPKQQQAKQQPDESSEGEDDGEGEESYENIEGAYNPKDYQHLNVGKEIIDLFQYIERYRPQEMELETTLKCFIPDYIPAIGEMDAYIKVARPDGKEDDLGLKFLDEPSATQSDPTVLELQLRAMSKKQQYGDVVVRSIENANKNPSAINKWIQSINDLHRSKPPPTVNYRRNMPDMESLMDVFPEEFEALLDSVQLPSPDLELSLPEYAKALCTILDIPTYENPVESLHLMFSLYMDFRNNPHFHNRNDAAAAANQQIYQAEAK